MNAVVASTIVFGVIIALAAAAAYAVTFLLHICGPNEVLVFSGLYRTDEHGRRVGYRTVRGGRGFRIPLFERVDRIDLTNMIVEVHVKNAFSKGGIPLTIQGVANLKVGGDEPLVNNAVERFLGADRRTIMGIATDTIEGNLRGVLATLTPEEVNADRVKFSQSLLEEAETDLAKLGLVLDNLKIQNVSDESGYLDSLGRKQSAEVLKKSRIAEARNKADSALRAAENELLKAEARIEAQTRMADADTRKRIVDAETKAEALVAEERSRVAALVARARAELDVQKARVEQVRAQLEADIVQPAAAARDKMGAEARARAARVFEDGKARADALRRMTQTWILAGPAARDVFMLQKVDAIFDTMLSTVGDAGVDRLTVIDRTLGDIDRDGALPAKALSAVTQIRETTGVDLTQFAPKK